MYASLNGAVKVCRERRTHPNLVYHCPWCDTSYSGPLPSTCRCGAVFEADPADPAPVYPQSFEESMERDSTAGAAKDIAAPAPEPVSEHHEAEPQTAPPLPAPRKLQRLGKGKRR